MLCAAPDLSARGLAEHIREDLRGFCAGGELEDDMTVVVLRIPQLAAAPRRPGATESVMAGAITN